MAEKRSETTAIGLPHTNAGAAVGGVLVFVLVAVLAAVNQELGAGHIPIPDAWRWCVPIAGAALVALVTALTPYVRMYGRD